MTVQDFLKRKLETCAAVEESAADVVFVKEHGIEEVIFQKVTSKQFRKKAIDDETKDQFRKAIHLNVSKSEPIQFTLPFGGYKIWRLPTSPEVDWAEFFMLCHYVSYLARISAIYEPGTKLSFSSDDIIIERMDNVPVADTDAYARSFRALLKVFWPHLPRNISLEFVRVAEMYPDRAEYEKELERNIPQFEKSLQELDSARLAKKQKSSLFNILWNGAKDLTGLPEAEKQEMIRMGPILHDAHCAVSRRRAFVRGENKILVFPSFPINNGIVIGSTKNSTVKFWTGIGVIEGGEAQPTERILSPQQYETAQSAPHAAVPVSLVPLKNFQTVTVFDSTFDFSQKQNNT